MESAAATQSAPPAAGNGADAESATIEVHRPADGSLIRSIPVDPPGRVAEVVGRVRANQAEWEAIGFAGRRRWLERLRDWMIDHEPRLADVMQEETGKVRAEAEAEAPLISAAINYYSQHGEEFLADETPTPNILPLRVKRLRIVYRPYPVVGVITPWNFPLLLALDDAVGALFAGCAVVIKPSEFTPFSIMEAVRGWKEDIGGPDVLDVVNGFGETGGTLIDEVDFVQFTGSDRTGKIVMKRAADTLTPVSLELRGKDPLIVLRDADLERAVNATAVGGLLNSGQACTSIERVYVEEPVYDEFVARLAEHVRGLRQGRTTLIRRRDRRHGHPGAGGHRLGPRRGRSPEGRQRPLPVGSAKGCRPVVRAHGHRGRRSLHEGDDRGDLRPGCSRDEGARRR